MFLSKFFSRTKPVGPFNADEPRSQGDNDRKKPAGNDSTHLGRRYEVLSVEKASAPNGGTGSNWHRYVIRVPGSTLTGIRRGSKQDVTRFATQYAEQLRARSSPHAKSAYAPARRK